MTPETNVTEAQRGPVAQCKAFEMPFGFVRLNYLCVPPRIANQCRERGICLRAITPHADGGRLFESVISLAARVYRKSPSTLRAEPDTYSRIYVACSEERVVGSITVTYARDGRLSTEEFLPRSLVDSLRAVVCSAYRLVVDPTQPESHGLAKMLMRSSFADGAANGMRLAVVTARSEMIAYYRRVGYLPLKDTGFVHPRLGTEHVAFACPTDPNHRSLFSDICQVLPDPVRRSALDGYLEGA